MKNKKLLMLLALLGVIFAFSSTVNAGLGNGLVAYWPFDDNAEDLAGGNHGTLVGNASYVSGKLGKAVSTSSVGSEQDYVQFDTTSDGLDGDWTVAVWINVHGQDIGSFIDGYFGDEANDDCYGLRLPGQFGATTNPGMTDYATNTNAEWGGIESQTQAYTPPAGTWALMVFVGSDTQCELFADGVSQGTIVYAEVNAEMQFKLTWDRLGSIVKYPGYAAPEVDFDEVAIWDRNLTYDEIQRLWNSGRGIAIGSLPSNPYPEDGSTIVEEDLTLSWDNIELPPEDPNVIKVEVWFGSDPCTLGPETWVKLDTIPADGTDVNSVDIGTPELGKYYWQVNTDIGEPNKVEGDIWSFEVVADPPPTVEMVTTPKLTWSGGGVPLEVNIENKGSAATIIEWANDAPEGYEVVVTDDDVIVDGKLTPTVTITKDFELDPDPIATVTIMILVSDAENLTPVEASIEIDVYDDACHMARAGQDKDNPNDLYQDCEIDTGDLAIIAATWLNDISIDAATVNPDQTEPNIVINGDFETIYEPGTTSPCTIEDGSYFNIGGQQMKGEGVATYADGSTGTGIELPGWTPVDGTNSDVMQAGTWGGIDGSMALLCFAGWGGPTTVESSAPLSLPVSGPGGEYELSAMINHPGRPIVLELLVDGVALTPDTSDIPDTSDDWTKMSNTYSSIPVGDVTVLVGTRDDAGTGWTGSRVSIDNVTLTVEVTDATLPTVDAGLNMITWSDGPVTLAPEVTDGELQYLWTAYPAEGVVFSDPVDSEDPNTSAALAPTVTITKDAGDVASVKLTLSVTLDGQSFVNDFITIDVYDNACLAGVAADPDTSYDLGDLNEDCTTNLDDFALLAAAWLVDYSSTGPLDRPEEE